VWDEREISDEGVDCHHKYNDEGAEVGDPQVVFAR
jgi:hypothetical protein